MKQWFSYLKIVLVIGLLKAHSLQAVTSQDLDTYVQLIKQLDQALADQTVDPAVLVQEHDIIQLVELFDELKPEMSASDVEILEKSIQHIRSELFRTKAPRVGAYGIHPTTIINANHYQDRDLYLRDLTISGSIVAPGFSSNIVGGAFLPLAGGTMTGDINMSHQTGIVFEDATDSASVTLQAPASVTPISYVLNLPEADGLPNQALVTDGAGNLSWSSAIATTSGIQSINLLTAPHQILTNGTAGTAPNWTTIAPNDQVLNIPQASTPGVTSGLVSNADYNNFNMKLSTTGGTIIGPLMLTSTLVLQNCNEIQFYNQNDTSYVGLRGPCTTPSAPGYSIILPTSQGLTGQVLGEVGNPAGQLGWLNTVTSSQAIALLYSATPADIPNTLVLRDGTGNFAASKITVTAIQYNTSSGSGSIVMEAPASLTSGSYNFILPPNTGTANEILSTDGTGVTNWISIGSLVTATSTCDYANTVVARDNTGSFVATTITLTGNSLINYGGMSTPFCYPGLQFIEAPTKGNTIIGINAGNNNNLTGGNNTVYGNSALAVITSGSGNTAIGFNALSGITSGSNNVALGANAGSAYTGTETNNIVIDNAGTTGDTNTIRIGTQGSQLAAYIAGIYPYTQAGSFVTVNSNGQLGISSITTLTQSNSCDVPNTLVLRDATGSFVATNVTFTGGIYYGTSSCGLGSEVLSVPTSNTIQVGSAGFTNVIPSNNLLTNLGAAGSEWATVNTGTLVLYDGSGNYARLASPASYTGGSYSLTMPLTSAPGLYEVLANISLPGSAEQLGWITTVTDTSVYNATPCATPNTFVRRDGSADIAVGTLTLTSSVPLINYQNSGTCPGGETLLSLPAINTLQFGSAITSVIPGVDNTTTLGSSTDRWSAINTFTTNYFDAANHEVSLALNPNNANATYTLYWPQTVGQAGYVLQAQNNTSPQQTAWVPITSILSGTVCDFPNTIVARDSTGSFVATTISLTGNSLIDYGSSNQCLPGTPFIEAPTNGNTIIGISAGNNNNLTGGNNTVYGNSALAVITSGLGNTAIGVNALSVITSGSNNVALGANAGSSITTQTGNIFIGVNAGQGYTGNNSIFLGYNGAASGDNVIYIGNPSIGINTGCANPAASTTIYGCINLPEVNCGTGYIASFDTNNQLVIARSSKRYKDNIKSLAPTLTDKVYNLRPVEFNYKQSPRETSYGLIAEETEAACPELVIYDEAGQPDSVNYLSAQVLALDALIKQHADINALNARCDVLTRMITSQNEVIAKLQQQIQELIGQY